MHQNDVLYLLVQERKLAILLIYPALDHNYIDGVQKENRTNYL